MSQKSGVYYFGKTLLKNVVILIIISVAGFFILTALLNTYTHHGESIDVPDLSGLRIEKIEPLIAEHSFNYNIVDSLFDGDKKPGVILDQDPKPGSKVKRNRTIYLTINATQPPDVKMPDLIDVSYRQALAILQSYGLESGDITYRSDLAKNAVLEQRYGNKIIKPGTMLPKGSAIDLVLGDGLGEIEVSVPDLTGLSKEDALSLLRRSSLNLGIIQYDDEDDTANAIIYRQYPSPDELLSQGGGVDIFLK